jgi:uncharacterized membrane protein
LNQKARGLRVAGRDFPYRYFGVFKMIQASQPVRHAARRIVQNESEPEQAKAERPPESATNVSGPERAVSIASGGVAALLGLARGGLPGWIIASIGGGLIYRGVTGNCPAYSALNISSKPDDAQHRIHVEQVFLINRSPEDLYQYWRNFENLPRIMTHLKSVRVSDDGHSHWVATAPRIAGGSVEWDAEITRDEPNAAIAWRSLPGSDIETTGQIRFSPAMGDRGTEVHVFMEYQPPAGRLGHWLATLFGEAPRRQMRDDLRNFKRLMECGEIPTIVGQPRGTCTGAGKRERNQ